MKRIGLSEPVDKETMQEILFANDNTKGEYLNMFKSL